MLFVRSPRLTTDTRTLLEEPMKKALLTAVTTIAMLAPLASAGPAAAAHTNHYGETSRRVAHEMQRGK